MFYLNVNKSQRMLQKYLRNKIYVDKSLLIEEINPYLDTGDNSICITRPRRFGKTYNANMLAAYYTKGCDSKDLFDGLKISQCDDYLEHLNQYNVVYIDFSIMSRNCESYNEYINLITTNIISDLESQYSVCLSHQYSLSEYFYQTNDSFIFILDELWEASHNSSYGK